MPNLAHASRTVPRMLVSKPARLVGSWQRSWCPGDMHQHWAEGDRPSSKGTPETSTHPHGAQPGRKPSPSEPWPPASPTPFDIQCSLCGLSISQPVRLVFVLPTAGCTLPLCLAAPPCLHPV